MCGNGTTIRDRREEATGTQYIHRITRFPSIIVIGGQSMILTTLTHFSCTAGAACSVAVRFRSAASGSGQALSFGGGRLSVTAMVLP